MKIDLKNPNFYYITIPILAGLWAILAGIVFYPKSVNAWDKGEEDSVIVEGQIRELVVLKPELLAYNFEGRGGSEEFDFTNTINDVAQKYSIDPSNYNLTVRGEANRGGTKIRPASMLIKSIDIEKLSLFLTDLLNLWPDLKCENLSIKKKDKNAKNNWEVTISLTYYY